MIPAPLFYFCAGAVNAFCALALVSDYKKLKKQSKKRKQQPAKNPFTR